MRREPSKRSMNKRRFFIVIAFECRIHRIIHHFLFDIIRSHILFEHLHRFLKVLQWHLNRGEVGVRYESENTRRLTMRFRRTNVLVVFVMTLAMVI